MPKTRAKASTGKKGTPDYFVDHKRGEVNELKAILRDPRLTRDPEKKREVIKKVIAYMTLGIDVSPIFSEMVMASNTKDILQKKMVYQYLASYAQEKPDLALLAINTLQKDCRDEDPMVRGLALRSLCSLRMPNLAEYVTMPIRKSMNDPSSYVRKTAVVGCAKLFYSHPESVKSSDVVDLLYNMLRDKDAEVIANVISALNEILYAEGGMAINTQIVMYLLNRVREFNEWAQCNLLDVVSRFTPESDDQMFDIMNLLEDRLQHSNSGVVLATTKVFLNFTKNHPAVHQEVFKRLKSPLLTLMGGSSFELSYTVLKHIKLIVERAPRVFEESFKSFFCRYNDPVCVKLIKLQILIRVCNDDSASELLNELAEYVTDENIDIARAAIKGMGEIGIRLDISADEAIEHLLSFLDLNIDYVSAHACIVLKDMLRKYPERYEDVLPALTKCLKTVEETEGKTAVIWMIGEYGDSIADAPYILEPLIDTFEDEPSHEVRNELLTASVKLFFKRPPEMQAMLGRLLSTAIADTQRMDVRDRALLYYRLLQLNVNEAARIVNCPKAIVKSFAEAENPEKRERIFAEFNTLSVIFDLPADKFVDAQEEDEGDEGDEGEEDDVPQQQQQSALQPAAQPVQPQPATATASGANVMNLDLLDFGNGSAAPAPAASTSLALQPNPVCDAPSFQAKWESLPSVAFEASVSNPSVGSPAVEAACAAKGLRTMASGAVGGTFKFFLYGSDGNTLYLLELNVNCPAGTLAGTAKAENGNVDGLVSLVRDVFSSL